MTTPLEIVFIDDNKVDCFIHQKVVKKSAVDCVVQSFNTGMEGLDYLRLPSENLQLIFLDIQMPVLNGFDVLDNYIGNHPSNQSQQHIYMLSSSEDVLDTERAKKYSVVRGFIPKPLNQENLKQVLVTLGIADHSTSE